MLFPLVKIDSFSHTLLKELYGCSDSDAQKNLDTIQCCFDMTYNKPDDYYYIAASIVPTKLNYKEIPSLVQRCLEHRTFPLLGLLEYAGNAIGKYNELLLSRDELLNLKNKINDIINAEYKVPICPSVISGIHIHNNGYVSVDKKSGLSCSWFWLKTPETVNLCHVNDIELLQEAEKKY